MQQDVFKAYNYRIYWHDDGGTILVCEVNNRWTWEEAHVALEQIDIALETQPHGVYIIYHFLLPISAMLPKGDLMPNIRQALYMETPNEQLNVLVGDDTLSVLQLFIETIMRAFTIQRHSPLKFARSFDDALRIISEHKIKRKE